MRHFRGSWYVQIHFLFEGRGCIPLRPRCASGSNLINSVAVDLFKYTFHFEGTGCIPLPLDPRLVVIWSILWKCYGCIYTVKYLSNMCLMSQRECNLQSIAMKFNTAMHMITVACALKSCLNRGLHGQSFLFLNLSWCFTNHTSYCLR